MYNHVHTCTYDIWSRGSERNISSTVEILRCGVLPRLQKACLPTLNINHRICLVPDKLGASLSSIFLAIFPAS